ncbi:uncharacterized protein LOC110037318, partial [Phalaenopsis equestris]|uniref:uncharacterized protein LOC110037318 n=1 Tax=Phalaenopsis equestris TaxID=78828 RepID=UPI0009E4A40C
SLFLSEESCYAAPSWERTFCSYVCRVPWRKICDADRVLCIHKNIANWDDSAGREAFQNAKARYWAKINGLPCNIPLPDPYMYVEKVDFDTFVDPKLTADLERSFFNPDVNNESAASHLDSSEHKPVPPRSCGEAEQSSSNWDKYIEKPTLASVWDEMAAKNSWGDGIAQNDPWQSRRIYSMDADGREASCGVSWKDQDEAWRHHQSWKNGEDRRNSDWKNMNSSCTVHDDRMNSSWKFSGSSGRNNYLFEKKVQPQRTWQRGQFLGSRSDQRTGYSGAQFQWENAVS